MLLFNFTRYSEKSWKVFFYSVNNFLWSSVMLQLWLCVSVSLAEDHVHGLGQVVHSAVGRHRWVPLVAGPEWRRHTEGQWRASRNRKHQQTTDRGHGVALELEDVVQSITKRLVVQILPRPSLLCSWAIHWTPIAPNGAQNRILYSSSPPLNEWIRGHYKMFLSTGRVVGKAPNKCHSFLCGHIRYCSQKTQCSPQNIFPKNPQYKIKDL